MHVYLIHFLFSLANSLSVWVSAALALIWFVALGFYVREKLAAGKYGCNPVKVEPFGADVVAKAEAHL